MLQQQVGRGQTIEVAPFEATFIISRESFQQLGLRSFCQELVEGSKIVGAHFGKKFLPIAQILTSTTIDFKREKNPLEQPIFFPSYIQNL